MPMETLGVCRESFASVKVRDGTNRTWGSPAVVVAAGTAATSDVPFSMKAGLRGFQESMRVGGAPGRLRHLQPSPLPPPLPHRDIGTPAPVREERGNEAKPSGRKEPAYPVRR